MREREREKEREREMERKCLSLWMTLFRVISLTTSHLFFRHFESKLALSLSLSLSLSPILSLFSLSLLSHSHSIKLSNTRTHTRTHTHAHTHTHTILESPLKIFSLCLSHIHTPFPFKGESVLQRSSLSLPPSFPPPSLPSSLYRFI